MEMVVATKCRDDKVFERKRKKPMVQGRAQINGRVENIRFYREALTILILPPQRPKIQSFILRVLDRCYISQRSFLHQNRFLPPCFNSN